MQIGCEDNRDQQCRKVESGTAGRRYNVISTVDCVDNVVNCRLDLLNDDGDKLIVCLARTRRQNALTCNTELDYTRNSAIAHRSRVSCVHKVTTVIKQLIEMTIKGDSRSPERSRFDRAHMISYYRSTETMALSCIVSHSMIENGEIYISACIQRPGISQRCFVLGKLE